MAYFLAFSILEWTARTLPAWNNTAQQATLEELSKREAVLKSQMAKLETSLKRLLHMVSLGTTLFNAYPDTAMIISLCTVIIIVVWVIAFNSSKKIRTSLCRKGIGLKSKAIRGVDALSCVHQFRMYGYINFTIWNDIKIGKLQNIDLQAQALHFVGPV